MKSVKVNDLHELKDFLAGFGEEVLFRGQTRHYGTADYPSAKTSFHRLGCIPNEMLRWLRYADEVLRAFIGEGPNDILCQAILQHYGFRSFYLDCSDAAAVSAWFAGHRYSDRFVVEVSEDCDEEPLFLRKKMADYDPADGKGNLYVLDKEACRRVGLTDLTAIAVPRARTRASVQRAYLLGPLQNQPLPADCFLAHVEAECAVFREMAKEAGFSTTSDLFPPSNEDPILLALLGLPWNPISGVPNNDCTIPAFRRAIELPEYNVSYVKIAPPAVAFYQGGMIGEFLDVVDGFAGGIAMRVPEVVIFGAPDPDFPHLFPHVMAVLEQHKGVLFETRALSKFPQLTDASSYQKGLAVELIECDLVHLGSLMVSHPGRKIDKAGVARGWFYRIGEDGVWRREAREEECPCGVDWPHLRHLASLHIVEKFLAKREDFHDGE